jgi:hypothetical protein
VNFEHGKHLEPDPNSISVVQRQQQKTQFSAWTNQYDVLQWFLLLGQKKWRRPGSNRRPSVDSFSKISLQNSSLTNQSDRQPEHQRLHTCLIGCISIYYYYLVSHQHNQSTALSGTGATMVYSPARHSDRYGTSSQLRLEYGDVAQALHHVSNRAHRGEQ